MSARASLSKEANTYKTALRFHAQNGATLGAASASLQSSERDITRNLSSHTPTNSHPGTNSQRDVSYITDEFRSRAKDGN